MKIEVQSELYRPQAKKYPWIGHRNNDELFLFTGPQCGVWLEHPSFVGTYTGGMLEHEFLPFEGTVTLSNEWE